MRLQTAVVFLCGLAVTATAQEGLFPAEEWPLSSLASVGLSETAFNELDQRIRNGDFGYVDRLVVVRDGQLVVDARYDNDYKEISRGSQS